MAQEAPGGARRREVACVLSDGTALHTVLRLPEGAGPWPALMMRHPYDVTGDEHGGMVDVARFVAAGYLVALQDVRGRFGSAGDFDPCAQEEADGAEAVAWLASLPECNGTVGMWGASYASDTQFAALLGGAPLAAIAATVTPALSALDGFRFRGGVPELGSTLAWAHYAIGPHAITRAVDPAERDRERQRWERTDAAIASGELFRPGAVRGPLDVESSTRWGLEKLRQPLDSEQHRAGKIVDRVGEIGTPVLLVGGWFDVFLGSTLELYRRLVRQAQQRGAAAPRLIVGPWSHSNMSGVISGVDFGDAASADVLWGDGDLTDVHLRAFDAALRGGGGGGGGCRGDGGDQEPAVRVFVMGTSQWAALPEFPPREARQRELYLGAEGALLAAPGGVGASELESDPANPVPTRGGAVLLFGPYDAGPADQQPIEARADVVSWRTESLESELTAMGAVHAVMYLSTTGTDADLVVRLCDEHPDGQTLVVADGVQRGSARGVDAVTGVGERHPLAPGEIHEFRVDLWSTAHTFLPGHRLRVDVTSSSSPRWEVGTNRYPAAGPDEAPTARYRVQYGPEYPSRIVLDEVD